MLSLQRATTCWSWTRLAIAQEPDEDAGFYRKTPTHLRRDGLGYAAVSKPGCLCGTQFKRFAKCLVFCVFFLLSKRQTRVHAHAPSWDFGLRTDVLGGLRQDKSDKRLLSIQTSLKEIRRTSQQFVSRNWRNQPLFSTRVKGRGSDEGQGPQGPPAGAKTDMVPRTGHVSVHPPDSTPYTRDSSSQTTDYQPSSRQEASNWQWPSHPITTHVSHPVTNLLRSPRRKTWHGHGFNPKIAPGNRDGQPRQRKRRNKKRKRKRKRNETRTH